MRKTLLLLLALGCAMPQLATAADARSTIGVAEFDNQAGYVSWWYAGAGRDLAASLSQELAATGAFVVMGQLDVDRALEAISVSADGEQLAQAEPGSRFLVRPAVSFYKEKRSSGSSRLRIKGVNLNGRRHSAQIAVDLEIVDLATGRIIYRDTLDARKAGVDMNVGYYEPELSGELSNFKGQPSGKAITAIVGEISREIECQLADEAACKRRR